MAPPEPLGCNESPGDRRGLILGMAVPNSRFRQLLGFCAAGRESQVPEAGRRWEAFLRQADQDGLEGEAKSIDQNRGHGSMKASAAAIR
jgi:hypothetical protein